MLGRLLYELNRERDHVTELNSRLDPPGVDLHIQAVSDLLCFHNHDAVNIRFSLVDYDRWHQWS